MTLEPDLPAGDFSAWLRAMRAALAEETATDVPCGDCSGCCASSHFVHIRPEETGSLAHVPPELQFAAPGLPEGHVVLGYDEDGRCPMLTGGGACSIYEHRPLTCRTYDCRVYAAAGIAADTEPIARRARRWKFSYAGHDGCAEHAAVRAAARFLRERAHCFPGGAAPRDPAQVAVLAVKVGDVFLARGDPSGGVGAVMSDAETARAVVEASAKFEARRARRRPPRPEDA